MSGSAGAFLVWLHVVFSCCELGCGTWKGWMMDVVCDLCASLCFATRGFAICCLRVVRCDVQVGDRNVKEVHMKKTRVQDCAVEALRLRTKRVLILSLCKQMICESDDYKEEARTCKIAVGIVCINYATQWCEHISRSCRY